MIPPNMEFHFINYSALVIVAVVIGVAGLLASSSAPSVAYNKLFGPVSSSRPSSSPASHMIFVSGKVKASDPPTFVSIRSSSSIQSGPPRSAGNKVVMINFDDGYKSQFLYAKPVLDQYGFKASFFIPCAKMQTEPKWLTWQQITTLKDDGMDIESHTMTHAHLPDLLAFPDRLTYEIGFAKQCLANHGFNTTIFGYPLNLGSENPTIVNLVAKYYNLARSGAAPLMFLNCKGFANDSQGDCRTYGPDGKLNYANRYDIRSRSFFHIHNGQNFSPSEMFQQFIQRMNSQIPYNSNEKINAIPIIVYHDLTYNIQDYNAIASTITVPLFVQEMQYLYDNGFKVLVLNQLGYDTTNNVFHLNGSPTITTTPATG
jgi:peptidoglycan/xylan/chitin deacetylase (PgdA/CDA1 family)